MGNVKFKDIVLSIMNAINIINPILKDHHRRVAVIAYHMGSAYGLSDKSLANLVIAACLHDIGALTVKDSYDLAVLDVENPEPHAILGYKMLSSYKALSYIAKIIRHHHVKYFEYNPEQENIPFESLILHISDRIDILLDKRDDAINQKHDILEQMESIEKHADYLFHPELITRFKKLSKKDIFWLDIDSMSIPDLINSISFDYIIKSTSYADLESLALTVSRIMDYKSPFTVTHSVGVAHVAYHLAKALNYPKEKCLDIKIAGYLHDIGKIAVPSEIISKPGRLNDSEYNKIKSHAYYTKKILEKIEGFEDICLWASGHHETIDGKGYPCCLSGNKISEETLIIAYADVFTALSENRPYRDALSLDEVLDTIKRKFKNKLGTKLFQVLLDNAINLNKIRENIQIQAYKHYLDDTI